MGRHSGADEEQLKSPTLIPSYMESDKYDNTHQLVKKINQKIPSA